MADIPLNSPSAVPGGRSATPAAAAPTGAQPAGWRGLVADWSGDQQTFQVAWGKAMMWIFLLSDTFIFGSFLTGYMTVRTSTTVPWPNPSEVFSLDIGGKPVPLLLIAVMTFILISSSGTMAMAVNCAYRRDKATAAKLMFATAAFGATFVGMQAFEWSKLILEEGVRPWGNPMGAAQFGSTFFMITGFHGLHVTAGVIYLSVVATRLLNGFYDKHKGGNYQIVEIAGLYWHFVDLVWVFIFALFYLW
ncbi:heme-copper oxidase subunit III family protein [Ideonella sp.]|uniref:heme-copper oxidase subunit III family protein n=1 Tax=Ideonella sp. TaxID=1929293 RepID=UPI002B465248|nr:heme-copper oxidase subunit III family protein [Ideonella sp.]HJV69001.1 heme-copper oxidase subunit III family protein [Ideonella sp.]